MFDRTKFEPLHDKRTVMVDESSISLNGQSKIVHLLVDNDIKICCPTDDLYTYGQEVVWQWEGVRGKFTTRLSKYIKDKLGIKINPDILEEIGKIAKDNSSDKHTTYIFDFDDKFDWNGGDFGDSSSCYFAKQPYNQHARVLLREFGCLAVRFYSKTKGIARAWVGFHPELDGFFVWNFYGDVTRFEGATALSSWLGIPYWSVHLSNSDFSADLLYLSGNSGMYIGPTPIEKFDFGKIWHEKCTLCDKPATLRGPDKKGYCKDCFKTAFIKCRSCGVTCDKHKSGYCANCLSRRITCPLCKKVKESSGHSVDGAPICRDCYYSLCTSCGKELRTITTVEGARICKTCAEKIATPCELCGKLSLKGKKRKTTDGMACVECYGNYKTKKCAVCDKRHKLEEADCEQ